MINFKIVLRSVFIVLVPLILTACLGNTAEDKKEDVNPNPGELTDNETYWEEFKLIEPKRNGLMNPYFEAVIDSDKNIHIVYYSVSEKAENISDGLYDLNYAIWNTTTQEFAPHPTAPIISTQTYTERMALAIDGQNQLYVSYRGGKNRACRGGTVPSDAMFSVFDGTQWTEYTGAIGYVERAGGALLDGYAGPHTDLVVDGEDNVHMIYQFLYEGCDATSAAYPDLFYASKMPSQFANDNRSDAEIEEQVSGNDADNGGTFQNYTGEVSNIILDADGNPLVFYYSEDSTRSNYGLFMGYRDDENNWITEAIRKNCKVVDISAGLAPNGDIHVAYVIDVCNDETGDSKFSLRHARKQPSVVVETEGGDPIVVFETEWENGYVVDDIYVGGTGRHLSMVMNKNGLPQIAYFELQTYDDKDLKNLKSIEVTIDGRYLKDDIARWNDIGRYNKMLTDQDGEIYVLSYDSESHSIHLFVEGVNGRLVSED